MLLAIDIGNTSIVLGIYKGKKLARIWRIPTDRCEASKYRLILRRLLQHAGIQTKKIKGIIICSVVPSATPAVKKALKQITGLESLIVGKDIVVPIRNLYKKPKQVGQDRLVNAIAVKEKYGSPAIIVDYGTAVTFDLVSKRGDYLGGIIVPGIEISLQALSSRAALLPKIEMAKPEALLGKDTVNSMRSGALHGLGALTDGLIAKLRKRYGRNIPAVATGGHAALIAKFCNSIKKTDPHLTLDGLRIIYQKEVAL